MESLLLKLIYIISFSGYIFNIYITIKERGRLSLFFTGAVIALMSCLILSLAIQVITFLVVFTYTTFVLLNIKDMK